MKISIDIIYTGGWRGAGAPYSRHQRSWMKKDKRKMVVRSDSSLTRESKMFSRPGSVPQSSPLHSPTPVVERCGRALCVHLHRRADANNLPSSAKRECAHAKIRKSYMNEECDESSLQRMLCQRRCYISDDVPAPTTGDDFETTNVVESRPPVRTV